MDQQERMGEIHQRIEAMRKQLTEIWLLACQKDESVPNYKQQEERRQDLQA